MVPPQSLLWRAVFIRRSSAEDHEKQAEFLWPFGPIWAWGDLTLIPLRPMVRIDSSLSLTRSRDSSLVGGDRINFLLRNTFWTTVRN